MRLQDAVEKLERLKAVKSSMTNPARTTINDEIAEAEDQVFRLRIAGYREQITRIERAIVDAEKEHQKTIERRSIK